MSRIEPAISRTVRLHEVIFSALQTLKYFLSPLPCMECLHVSLFKKVKRLKKKVKRLKKNVFFSESEKRIRYDLQGGQRAWNFWKPGKVREFREIRKSQGILAQNWVKSGNFTCSKQISLKFFQEPQF